VITGYFTKHERPRGVILTRVRRTGVEPSMGCLVGFPVWLATRVRWQLSGKRTWSVEVRVPNRSGVGGRIVALEECVDRERADHALVGIQARADRGEFDAFLG
jgi:hypothetical protein